jgi:thioredoxin 1
MARSPQVGAIVGAVLGILIASAFAGHQEELEASPYLLEVKTEGDFEQLLAGSEVVLVDFSSARCSPCRRLKPIVNELATDYAGRVAVALANVDEVSALARRYGVTKIPAVKIFKNGDLETTVFGPRPKKEYADVLDALLVSKTGGG